MCMCVPRSLILGEMMMIVMIVMVMTNWLLLSSTLPTYLPYLTCTSRVAGWQSAEGGGRVR